MQIIPSEHRRDEIYKLLTGCVVPRPIAFVSSLSRQGVLNLAPFSFFSVACPYPPILCFAPGRRPDGRKKDSVVNAETTGEFVINVVTAKMAEGMNATAFDFEPEVDEFAISGFTPVASDLVKPPRVAESPIQMECRTERILEFGNGHHYVVFGEVLKFHLNEAILDDSGQINVAALHPIGRLNRAFYCRTDDQFKLMRPLQPGAVPKLEEVRSVLRAGA